MLFRFCLFPDRLTCEPSDSLLGSLSIPLDGSEVMAQDDILGAVRAGLNQYPVLYTDSVEFWLMDDDGKPALGLEWVCVPTGNGLAAPDMLCN